MKTLTQSKLYALCREHGWKPLFFSRKSSSISAESLEREIQVCLAAGQQTLSRHLLDAAHHEFGETLAHDEAQLSSGGSAVGADRSPSVANRLLRQTHCTWPIKSRHMGVGKICLRCFVGLCCCPMESKRLKLTCTSEIRAVLVET